MEHSVPEDPEKEKSLFSLETKAFELNLPWEVTQNL